MRRSMSQPACERWPGGSGLQCDGQSAAVSVVLSAELSSVAKDILPPLSSTASEMPSCEAQEASVRDLTRGWICVTCLSVDFSSHSISISASSWSASHAFQETLRELWRDEERRCTGRRRCGHACLQRRI